MTVIFTILLLVYGAANACFIALAFYVAPDADHFGEDSFPKLIWKEFKNVMSVDKNLRLPFQFMVWSFLIVLALFAFIPISVGALSRHYLHMIWPGPINWKKVMYKNVEDES